MTCQVLFEEGIKQTYLIPSRFFIVQNLLKSRRLWSQPEEVGFCVYYSTLCLSRYPEDTRPPDCILRWITWPKINFRRGGGLPPYLFNRIAPHYTDWRTMPNLGMEELEWHGIWPAIQVLPGPTPFPSYSTKSMPQSQHSILSLSLDIAISVALNA